MKGLLLKDLFAIRIYCRAFMIIFVAFSVFGGITKENYYFTYYTCIFAGSITMSLIAYEERENWEQYATTLPYTKAQMVSSKYIVSLCFGGLTVFLNTTTQFLIMIILKNFDSTKLLSTIMTGFPLALLPSAFMLPFIYKSGVNKGRIAYLLVFGAFSGAIVCMPVKKVLDLTQISIGILIFILSMVIYIFSWYLSIRLYENREI